MTRKYFLSVVMVVICNAKIGQPCDQVYSTYAKCLNTSIDPYSMFDQDLLYGGMEAEKLCVVLNVTVKCAQKAYENLTEDCQGLTVHQSKHHIAGLEAYALYECGNNAAGLIEERSQEVQKCVTAQKKKLLVECDSDLKYSRKAFIPLPVLKESFDASLWSVKDCNKKFDWFVCQIDVLQECDDERAYNHFKKLYTTLLRAYATCNKTLDEKLKMMGVTASSNYLSFIHIILVLPFLPIYLL